MSQYRHAVEQASRRWRGGRRDDSARTRRNILISTQASWGANYTKLQQIKAKYDPTNMFRLNHNVEPAAAPAAAASPTRPKPRRSLSGRVLSALSPGKKK